MDDKDDFWWFVRTTEATYPAPKRKKTLPAVTGMPKVKPNKNVQVVK